MVELSLADQRKSMNLIFWHNIISPHQASYMRELAKAGHDVLVVSFEDMSEDRRQLGWSIPSLEPARVLLCSETNQVEKIIRDSSPDSIHIIAGARAVALGSEVAGYCHALGRRMGIVTESPDPRGLGGWLRQLKYSWERIYRGKHFDFILAMGEIGVDWFRQCGYPKDRIFPFVYVTDQQVVSPPQIFRKVFRFIFVGRLIHLKGLDLLLRAVMHTPGVELFVIGDGPERESLENIAFDYGIAERVRWMGQMRNEQIIKFLSEADVLVLPSRKDGWGAVVNEALMAGTPVICSDVCGASELIRHSWLGSVFRANDIDSLQAALEHWSSKSTITYNHRQRVRAWAQCIDGVNVAKYFESVLCHVYVGTSRPEPPWRESDYD